MSSEKNRYNFDTAIEIAMPVLESVCRKGNALGDYESNAFQEDEEYEKQHAHRVIVGQGILNSADTRLLLDNLAVSFRFAWDLPIVFEK